MIREEKEKAFARKMKKLLNEAEEQTAPEIRVRLRAARFKALESFEKPLPWYLRVPRLVTVSGLVTAMLLVLTLSLWKSGENYIIPSGQVEDLEILTTNEQLELYKDLDFYLWLETSDYTG